MLDAARVRAAVAGTAFANVDAIERTASTNADVAPHLGEAGWSGRTLVADFQSAGQGRRDRAWIAAPGGALLFTTALPAAIPASALWALPFWTALAVADGIEASTGIAATLQWPNDLLIDGKKCCGILCLSRVRGAEAWAGCGVGLNVRRDESALAIVPAPAFLSDRVADVEREPVLAAILAAMDRSLAALADPGNVARVWERRANLGGTRYRLRLDADGETFEAPAMRLDDAGNLVVATPTGQRTVTLADARVLRDP